MTRPDRRLARSQDQARDTRPGPQGTLPVGQEKSPGLAASAAIEHLSSARDRTPGFPNTDSLPEPGFDAGADTAIRVRGAPAGQPGLSEAAGIFRHAGPAPFNRIERAPMSVLREYVATGRMSEARMLDIAGGQLGIERVSLDLVPPDPAFDHLLAPQFCLKHALVPWRRDDDTIVVATARPELVPNLGALLPRELGPVRAVLAPCGMIQGHIARRHRSHLARAMASRVPESESFRAFAPTLRRALIAVSAASATIACMLLWPGAMLGLLYLCAVISLSAAIGLKTASAIAQLHHEYRLAKAASDDSAAPPALPLTDLPVISVLVPLFRERRIAETLVRRLEQIDYPRGRLDVLLVLEEEDRLTAAALRDAKLPPWMRVITVPDGKPRTKPRAMNYALDFCRGDIVGIYDAEDAPDPEQLLSVAAHFATAADDLACLQGALDYYNPRQNWLARCFTIEYNTWFRLLLPGMARLGFGIPLGGTTLFVRRDVLEAVGGWDAHNVTEDADLGFRLSRHGWRTEVIATTTREEANCRPLAWIRQRSRWIKGYMVTYIVHMRRPLHMLRQIGLRRFLGFQIHFLSVVSLVLFWPVVMSCWVLLLGLPHPMTPYLSAQALGGFTLLFLGFEALNLSFGLIATRRAEHRHLWPWVPTMILYFPLVFLAACKASYELLVAPFYWDKTQHGLSLRGGLANGTNDAAAAPEIAAPNRSGADSRAAAAHIPAAHERSDVTIGAGDYSTGETAPESSLSRVTKALEM